MSGATVLSGLQTEFAVWAPRRTSVEVLIERDGSTQLYPMRVEAGGFFRTLIEGVGPGTRYAFRLDESIVRPDPCSRFQPEGVHGRSQVIDPASYKWKDDGWVGIEKSDLVIYEFHIGTFTQAGTFRAAIERLSALRELGITVIEVMPVAQAPGRWNWGYDGVNLFAPSHNYGQPDDFRAFVDAAHAVGLAVMLDVVYNHLGPEGNYLSDFGPYFSQTHHTPWGEAFNFDGAESGPVRQYIIENALSWLDEFHLDGLRLDAVDAMFDTSPVHILHAIRKAVTDYSATVNHRIHLIAEANRYDRRLLHPPDDVCDPYDAIWCDDVMHSIYAVSAPDAIHVTRPYQTTDLEECLEHGYIYVGPPEHRVSPTERLRLHPAGTGDELHSFVIALQNHDVIGNDVHGQRFHHLTSRDTQKAAAALVLLFPSIPLLFMGEEIAADSPFRFFTDFGDEHLRCAVDEGRAREYPDYNRPGSISAIDPLAFSTSKLDGESDPVLRDWYQSLLRIRKKWQSDGVLRSDRLITSAWHERQVYALQYRDNEATDRYVITRLSTPDASNRSVTVRLNGTIELQNLVTSIKNDTTQQEVDLPANGVIVGRGRFSLL
ncbi:MAG: malto-oligosyltrehalose trehalohydrolase [Planctomycetaceae bacterium]